MGYLHKHSSQGLGAYMEEEVVKARSDGWLQGDSVFQTQQDWYRDCGTTHKTNTSSRLMESRYWEEEVDTGSDLNQESFCTSCVLLQGILIHLQQSVNMKGTQGHFCLIFPYLGIFIDLGHCQWKVNSQNNLNFMVKDVEQFYKCFPSHLLFISQELPA